MILATETFDGVRLAQNVFIFGAGRVVYKDVVNAQYMINREVWLW